MKKVLNYIFKDWKISDYIFGGLAVLAMLAVLLISKCVKSPAEIKDIFSVAEFVCAILFVWGMVFCSKQTIHGYILGIGSFAFLSYFLFNEFLYGSFIVAMILIAYLIYRLVMLCLKKEIDFGKFGLWDYVFLFGGLAICAYPAYMLNYTINSNSIVSEVLVILAVVALLYLSFKKNRYAKLLAMAVAGLMTVSVALLLLQLELANTSLAVGLLLVFVFEIVECIKLFTKNKEIKKD